EIVRQNRAAIAWLWQNAGDIGIDRDRIHVCGHSAGGHLVTMLLATQWPEFCPGVPANLIKSGCAISGLYELEPVRLTYLNDTLRMDAAMAARNSPLQRDYPAGAPLLIVVGGAESEEFLRQSKAMTDQWKRLGYDADLVAPQGLNHFSIVDEFARPDNALVNKQLEHIV
ncbi:MAG: alpha/beta hydrolase, partial [Gammaproteobacteria bacterium]